MSEAEFQSDSGGNPASVTKRGGYQGSFDPGEPTRLMQPQTVPVGQQAPPEHGCVPHAPCGTPDEPY